MGFFKISEVVIERLEAVHRRYLALLLISMVLVVVIETGTLSLIAMYAAAVSDPDAIFKSPMSGKWMQVLGKLAPSNARELIVIFSLLVVLAVFVKNMCSCSLQYCLARYTASISGYFGRKLLEGLILMPYEWHLKQNSADLLNTFYWRDQISNGLIKNLLQVCCDILLVFFLFAVLIIMSPFTSLAAIAVVGFVAWFIFKLLSPLIDKKSNKNVELATSIARGTMYFINGIKDVKLFGAQYKISKLSGHLQESALLQGVLASLMRAPYDLLEFVGFLMIAGVIVIMNVVTQSSSARVTGTVTLLAVAAWRVLPALNRIISGLSGIRASLPMASRVLEHLAEFEKESKDRGNAKGTVERLEFKECIEYRDVSFKYDGASFDTISNINVQFRKGQTIGLVGPSGAGKSTTVDILIGFLNPQEGEVLIDGVPLTDGNKLSWMSMIGYVPQSPYISDDTLASNIAFGAQPSDTNREWIRECCRMANVDEFLTQLPKGIDSQIGERGVRLSGGQRQRVAIARALFRRPEVIILDEATSALDTKSEEMIQRTILGLRGRITMIIIAHRLSTVEHCDRVLWLENGRLRMFGCAKDVIKSYRDVNKVH